MRVALLALALALISCAFERGYSDPAPNGEPLAGCAMECHGDDNTNAPPKSLSGATDTMTSGVGAHRPHAIASPAWHRKVVCSDCHVVPQTVDAPGHIDGDDRAEVVFGGPSGTSTWIGNTCMTHCHGQPAWGGVRTSPIWTQVDGTQATCGSCHGVPPPPPHPTETNCASCHPTMEENSLKFRDPDSHINGIVDLVDPAVTGGCAGVCHGSTNAAPPKDLVGNTARTARGVGAHQQHLAMSTWHREVTCSSCHVVPQTANSPGHRDGDNLAEVTFDALNPSGTYSAAAATCSTQYCHGNGRSSNGTISWLTVGPLSCNACHSTTGSGMSGRHSLHIVDKGLQCSQCHGTVVDANKVIINAQLHVDGARQIKMVTGTYNPANHQCSNTGCHDTKTWFED